jgi:hypothetical protein
VRKWIFFTGVFFEGFTENFSSFIAALSLVPAGFSSAVSLRLPILVPLDVGTDEAAEIPMQVLELQGTFSSGLPERSTPALLP